MDVWHQDYTVSSYMKIFVVIHVLMLKSIIAYLHGHSTMLIAVLILFLKFEFIVLQVIHQIILPHYSMEFDFA